MIFDSLYRSGFGINLKIARCNWIIYLIIGDYKLYYDRFEYIMTKILKEPIPDDPELIKIAEEHGINKALRDAAKRERSLRFVKKFAEETGHDW